MPTTDVYITTTALSRLKAAAKTGKVDPELTANFLTELESNLMKMVAQANKALNEAKQ